MEGLCWQSYGPPHSRPTTYRAPSWSWASIDGLIAITSLGRWEDVVEVIDVQVQVKGENLFGEVSSGSIELRAPLERISIRDHKLSDNEELSLKQGTFRWWYGTGEKEGEGEMNRGRFDIETDMELNPKSLELYLLPLAVDFTDDDLTCFALVVMPYGEGRYKRVGWSLNDSVEQVLGWKELKEKGKLPRIFLV